MQRMSWFFTPYIEVYSSYFAEGDFRHLDGSKPVWVEWLPGEPDNRIRSYKNADCTAYAGGSLRDALCGIPKRFVCERSECHSIHIFFIHSFIYGKVQCNVRGRPEHSWTFLQTKAKRVPHIIPDRGKAWQHRLIGRRLGRKKHKSRPLHPNHRKRLA